MKTGKKWISTGLVFFEYREFDIVKIANCVLRDLEALGRKVTSVHVLSEQSTLVTTPELELRISVLEDVSFQSLKSDVSCFITLEARNRGMDPASLGSLDTTLIKLLKALQRRMNPDFIKWIDSDVFIGKSQFRKAARVATADEEHKVHHPRPMAARHVLPAIEYTNDVLQQRLAEQHVACAPLPEDVKLAKELRPVLRAMSKQECVENLPANHDIREESDTLRLSAWFLSLAVAMFALPVGVALMFFNLVRGENLRLTSQAAALTGTFVAFQTLGTTGQAMEAIQGILG